MEIVYDIIQCPALFFCRPAGTTITSDKETVLYPEFIQLINRGKIFHAIPRNSGRLALFEQEQHFVCINYRKLPLPDS
jgi:hypothetical protein